MASTNGTYNQTFEFSKVARWPGETMYKPRMVRSPRMELEDIAKDFGNMESRFSGINNSGDVRGVFGIPNISAAFDPAKQGLAQQKGQALAGASQRAGSSATAERSIFSGIEQHFANAYTQLVGQEATAKVDQDTAVAQMLMSIFGEQDAFGMNKANAQAGIYSNIWQGDLGQQGLNIDRDRLKFEKDQAGGDFWDFLGTAVGSAVGFLV